MASNLVVKPGSNHTEIELQDGCTAPVACSSLDLCFKRKKKNMSWINDYNDKTKVIANFPVERVDTRHMTRLLLESVPVEKEL